MRAHHCPCGHRAKPRQHAREPYAATLTMVELLEPHRLTALLTARPDLDGIGLVRVAQGIAEGA